MYIFFISFSRTLIDFVERHSTDYKRIKLKRYNSFLFFFHSLARFTSRMNFAYIDDIIQIKTTIIRTGIALLNPRENGTNIHNGRFHRGGIQSSVERYCTSNANEFLHFVIYQTLKVLWSKR